MNPYRFVSLCLRLAFFLSACAPVWAGPMGYKDSTMLMGDFSSNWRELWVNYAITPRDALGVGTLYMRSDDETRTRQLHELTYTHLLKRWNFPGAQANVWLPLGVGEMQGNDFGHGKMAVSPGLLLDAETRRWYLSGSFRAYRAQGIHHDFRSVRAGVSFYETSYEETQPWFILEARRMHDLSEKTEITPMLRLINKRFFVELGYSNLHEARFNLMIIL